MTQCESGGADRRTLPASPPHERNATPRLHCDRGVFDLWSTTGAGTQFPSTRLSITPLIAELRNRAANPDLNEIIPHRITELRAFFPNSASMFGWMTFALMTHASSGCWERCACTPVTRISIRDPSEHRRPVLDYLNVATIVTRGGELSQREFARCIGSDGKIYQNRDALPRF